MRASCWLSTARDPNGQADFFRVATSSRQAEVCDRFLARGQRVAVDGRLRSSWEDSDGTRRTAVEIVAAAVEFLSRRELKAVAAAAPVEAAAA